MLWVWFDQVLWLVRVVAVQQVHGWVGLGLGVPAVHAVVQSPCKAAPRCFLNFLYVIKAQPCAQFVLGQRYQSSA